MRYANEVLRNFGSISATCERNNNTKLFRLAARTEFAFIVFALRSAATKHRKRQSKWRRRNQKNRLNVFMECIRAWDTLCALEKVTKSKNSFNFIERLCRRNNNRPSATPNPKQKNLFCVALSSSVPTHAHRRQLSAETAESGDDATRCQNEAEKHDIHITILPLSMGHRVCQNVSCERSFYRNLETITVKQHIKSVGGAHEDERTAADKDGIYLTKEKNICGLWDDKSVCDRSEGRRKHRVIFFVCFAGA